MEAMLSVLLPRILGAEVTYRFHDLGGKWSLLTKLEKRLKGYAEWIPDDYRILILVDRDSDDCKELKKRICESISAAGLTHKSEVPVGQMYQCAIRIPIEELEAWLFGDCPAIRAVYPKVPSALENKSKFRDPDAIAGGTWEQLERVLQRAGYHLGGLPKVEVAAEIAEHMDVWSNKSRSFGAFRDLVISL